ncbi:XVIPCD domain-containing protein, partial [Lysobacter sp. 2RAB21]
PQEHNTLNTLHHPREIMETNGLDLGAATKQPYFDTSTTPPTAANFHHTKDTHRPVRDPIAPTHDAPAHSSDPLLQGIRDQVQAEFARHGSPLSERDADRVAAALAVQSKNAGMG